MLGLAMLLQPMRGKLGISLDLMSSRSALSTIGMLMKLCLQYTVDPSKTIRLMFKKSHPTSLSFLVAFGTFLLSLWGSSRPPSPTDNNERALHNAARRAGLTFPCDPTYLDIPVCTGYDDYGAPIVAVKPWPFLLPSDMVPCNSVSFICLHMFLVDHILKHGCIDHFFCASIFVCTWHLCPLLRRKHWWMMDILKRSLTWMNWMGIGSTC